MSEIQTPICLLIKVQQAQRHVFIFGERDSPEYITNPLATTPAPPTEDQRYFQYNELKASLPQSPLILQSIRIENISFTKDFVIGFRRKINGEWSGRRFILPYFLLVNQFMRNIFMTECFSGLPLDGKTEIYIETPEDKTDLKLYLFPKKEQKMHSDEECSTAFLSVIHSPFLYDDCIEVINNTKDFQYYGLTLTGNGAICDNENLIVKNHSTYTSEDEVYIKKTFSTSLLNGKMGSPDSITVVGENGTVFNSVQLFHSSNSYNLDVIDIPGRVRLSGIGKKIITSIRPESSWFLFVNKNKKPAHNILPQRANYRGQEFNSAKEVECEIEHIDEQKKYLCELLEKNDFPL